MTNLDKAIDKLKAEVEKAKIRANEDEYSRGRYDGLLRSQFVLLMLKEDIEGEQL